MKHKHLLLEMINRLLSGEWTVPEFRDNYYNFFLEKIPDDALSEDDWEFFGAIQEKLDWTDPIPDPESQKDGWLNYGQYVDWVRSTYLDYSQKSGG
jgi:hypothetical protein